MSEDLEFLDVWPGEKESTAEAEIFKMRSLRVVVSTCYHSEAKKKHKKKKGAAAGQLILAHPWKLTSLQLADL